MKLAIGEILELIETLERAKETDGLNYIQVILLSKLKTEHRRLHHEKMAELIDNNPHVDWSK